jgi:hypothetical protein
MNKLLLCLLFIFISCDYNKDLNLHIIKYRKWNTCVNQSCNQYCIKETWDPSYNNKAIGGKLNEVYSDNIMVCRCFFRTNSVLYNLTIQELNCGKEPK